MSKLPAIPVEVTYDCMVEGFLGYWDLWVGIQPCKHVEFKVSKLAQTIDELRRNDRG